MKKIAIVFSLLACLGAMTITYADTAVNPALENHVKAFSSDPESLESMSPAAFMAEGYDYSNFGFIVGDSGVIMVDCGWVQEYAGKAFDDLKKITDKPVVALIYTHGHADHVSGCPDEVASADIPVYAHENYIRYRNEQVSSRLPFILRRGAAQMGSLLPEESTGNVGTGIGKLRGGSLSYAKPTHLVKGGEKLRIAGVDIEIIEAFSDIDDEIAVWVPNQKVMFVGDLVGGTGPYASTPRNEHGRDPENFVTVADKMLGYPIEYMIPGHGRAVKGADDVRRVLTNARDITQFMIDDIVRGLNAGKSREEIIFGMQIPPHLASDPDLQWYYHPRNWVARGIYSRLAGWMGDDPLELVTLPPHETAEKMVEAMGGVDQVVRKAQRALDGGDYRWAAQLAIQARRIDPYNEAAKDIEIAAIRQVAYQSDSSSQRYYSLAHTGLLDGSFSYKNARPLINAQALLNDVSYRRLAEAIRPRIDAPATYGIEQSINLEFIDEGTLTLTIRRGILQISDYSNDPSLPRVSLKRGIYIQALLGVLSGRIRFTDMLDLPGVSLSDRAGVEQFFQYLK